MTSLGGMKALEDVRDLLQKTPNITDLPAVQLIYDEKATGVVSEGDSIFLKYDGEDIQYFLHGDDTWHTVYFSIDVWTRNSFDRLNDLVGAIFSNIKTNIRFVAPVTNTQYTDLLIVGNHPQSEDYRNIFRHILDGQIRILNPQ